MAILLLPAALAACGDYAPPVVADRRSPKYVADLTACQDIGSKEANTRSVAFFRDWLAYPLLFPIRERRDITQCMTAKGYVLRS